MDDEARYQPNPDRTSAEWDAAEVRRLREHLGATQAELAERLGTRQQTVSEWETGASRPRRMARRLLSLVAEERGFYEVDDAGRESDREPGRTEREDGRDARAG
jgi:transcriptional regulator with XRE-family HTH domain